MTGNAVTAVAHPNIALVKYWGKRDSALNLPAAGSLSLTLGPIRTRTTVEFGIDGAKDEVWFDERPAPSKEVARLSRFLDLVRQMAGTSERARVVTSNDFPTAAGLASSSSGFAALALAATHAAGLALPESELSVLARRGSGSAARSIFGGFAVMDPGVRADGTDAFARPLEGADWPLEVVIAVTVEGAKDVSSTVGMEQTERTSPYFDAWIREVPRAITEATEAILARDFARLADLAEASALQMHASAIAAVPGVIYWRGATIEVVHEVRRARAQGLPVFFTIDAGPHVKVFTTVEHAEQAASWLGSLPGVLRVIRTRAAGGAQIVSPASSAEIA